MITEKSSSMNTKMLEEVKAAANFLAGLMQNSGRVNRDCVDRFRNTLESCLHDFYAGHWFPEKPQQGSGYRCIRINHKMDPLLDYAAKESGIANVLSYFPHELTMWVDPFDVSYRIGENGSIGQVYGISLASQSFQSIESVQSSAIELPRPFGKLMTCKDHIRSSVPKHAMLTPFAAFVSS